MNTLSSLVLSVFAYLGPLGQLQWKNPCCRKISWKWEKLIEKTGFIRTFALIVVVQSVFPMRVVLAFVGLLDAAYIALLAVIVTIVCKQL